MRQAPDVVAIKLWGRALERSTARAPVACHRPGAGIGCIPGHAGQPLSSAHELASAVLRQLGALSSSYSLAQPEQQASPSRPSRPTTSSNAARHARASRGRRSHAAPRRRRPARPRVHRRCLAAASPQRSHQHGGARARGRSHAAGGGCPLRAHHPPRAMCVLRVGRWLTLRLRRFLCPLLSFPDTPSIRPPADTEIDWVAYMQEVGGFLEVRGESSRGPAAADGEPRLEVTRTRPAAGCPTQSGVECAPRN